MIVDFQWAHVVKLIPEIFLILLIPAVMVLDLRLPESRRRQLGLATAVGFFAAVALACGGDEPAAAGPGGAGGSGGPGSPGGAPRVTVVETAAVETGSIAREVENLAAEGAVELSLIAQDLTAYGLDLGDGTDLEKLLRRLIEIDGIRWIRLLYNYPMYFTDGLIDVIANSEKICKYVDIPLQHIDSDLLATMRRKVDEREVRGLLEKLKSSIPGLALRTTLIVGFPGESAEQFGRLVDFVKEYEFNRLGVFTYSQEERTAAAKMPGQIPTKVKKERRNRIMAIAQKISARKNLEKLGRVFDVLIDRALESPNGYSHVGRTEGQALDIDGQVFVAGASMRPGTFVRAKVEKAGPYDLFARTY